MIPSLLVLLRQLGARPSHRYNIRTIDYLPSINVRIIVGSDVDVDLVVFGDVISACHLIDDIAILEHTSTQQVVTRIREGHRTLISDLSAIGCRGFRTVGSVDNHSVTVAGSELSGNLSRVIPTRHIDRNSRVKERLHIGSGHIIGHTVDNGVEYIVSDTVDVGRLARVIAITQDKIDLVGIQHGMYPSHATDNDTVVITILPAREVTRHRVALVIKGVDPRQIAAVILDIDNDVVIVGTLAHQILASHDAVGTNLAVGQNAHLEGRVLVKREVHTLYIGNLFAVGIGILTIGRINQYGALGRGFHIHRYRRVVITSALVDDRIAIDEILLDIAVHLIGQRRGDAQAACALVIAPHLGKALGNACVHSLIAQLQIQVAVLTRHTPCDTVRADILGGPNGALVGDAGSAASLDEACDEVMPYGMHEVRIEQTRRARHRQDEAVGLDNLTVDTMLIIAVAGVSRQILEGIVVVDERHGIAFEAIIPDEAIILERAEVVPALVIERLSDLLLQGEVKGCTLETALVIYALDPIHNIASSAPELTYREGGPNRGVVVGEMLGFKAARIVVAEADIA